MTQYGVDSKIGMMVSTVMGSTETTLYTIAIYTSVVKIKKTRGILIAALIGDVVRNVGFCHNMSNDAVKSIFMYYYVEFCRKKIIDKPLIL